MADQHPQTRRSEALRLSVSLLIAALVHVGLFVWRPSLLKENASQHVEKRVELVALAPWHDIVEADRRRRPANARPVPSAPAPSPTPPRPDPVRGQVVDLPPSQDSRPPEHAEYLSEHNTRTEHETRSRHQSADYRNVMSEPTARSRPKAQGEQANQASEGVEVGPRRTAATPKTQPGGGAAEVPRVAQQDRLALQTDPQHGDIRNREGASAVQGNSDRLKLVPKQDDAGPAPDASAPQPGLTMADLVPQVGVLARLDGGPSNDALEHVDEGEGTFLNSREFRYASFFNRLKRGVSQNWRPLVEFQRRDPTGNVYGWRTRVTVVSVTLRADGSLANVEVKQSSGVDFLDNEAIAAFRRSEPFPNPPRGLIDASGKITFPFGFHVDIGGRGGLQSPF